MTRPKNKENDTTYKEKEKASRNDRKESSNTLTRFFSGRQEHRAGPGGPGGGSTEQISL
jgi:hypothetical protein